MHTSTSFVIQKRCNLGNKATFSYNNKTSNGQTCVGHTEYSAYLQQDYGDDGHLRTQPGEQTLELPTLTNQVTVNYDSYQAHSLHCSLVLRERKREREIKGCLMPPYTVGLSD